MTCCTNGSLQNESLMMGSVVFHPFSDSSSARAPNTFAAQESTEALGLASPSVFLRTLWNSSATERRVVTIGHHDGATGPF